jgi:hypothetical protein
MKIKIILSFLVLTTIYSCSNLSGNNEAQKIKDGAESFLKGKLKDPDSYQNISTSILDSVKKSKSLEDWLEYCDSTKIDSIKNVINKLKQNPKLDSLDYISIEIQYRAKNGFGALDLGKAIVYYIVILPPSKEQYFLYSNK